MTYKEHISKSIQLAIPVIITQVGQIAVNVADTIMVGKLGVEKIASISLGNAIFFTVLLFGIGFSFSLSPLVAQAHATFDKKRINTIFNHGLWLHIMLGIIIIALVFLTLPIIHHLNQPENVLPDAKQYLKINLFSLIPIMIFQTYRQVSEGISQIYVVTIATLLANIINIFFNYGLIYGNFGMPRLEVAGAAYATLISRICMIFIICFLIYKNPKTKDYFTISYQKLEKKYIKLISSLGIPTAFQMFFEVSAFAASAFICGYNAQVKQLAAHQITLNLASISFMICTGLAVSATIRVGNQLGLKDYKTLQKAAFTNFILVMGFMFLSGIIFVVCREFLPKIYLNKNPDKEVILIASKLMIVAAFFQIFDGLQVVALGALRGLQDVKIPTIITFVAYYVITLPLGWILAITYDLKALGMWIALGIGLGISALLLLMRFWNKSNALINQKQ